MEPLILKESNIIILGAWNLAIINPVWLRNQFPLLIATDEKFEANLISGPVQKIRYKFRDIIIDPDIDRDSPRYPSVASPGRVRITTRNGNVYETRVDVAKGNPRNPMTIEEIKDKFYHCASHASEPVPKKNLDEVIDRILRLEQVEDVSTLPRLLVQENALG